MFSFLNSKTTPDLSFISIDMHSHLLPGLDDGLQEIEQTMIFIQELKQLGYKKLICTPHILSDVYANSPETILPKLELVRIALKEKNIDMPVGGVVDASGRGSLNLAIIIGFLRSAVSITRS